jgi:hypothetical protein
MSENAPSLALPKQDLCSTLDLSPTWDLSRNSRSRSQGAALRPAVHLYRNILLSLRRVRGQDGSVWISRDILDMVVERHILPSDDGVSAVNNNELVSRRCVADNARFVHDFVLPSAPRNSLHTNRPTDRGTEVRVASRESAKGSQQSMARCRCFEAGEKG